MNRKFEQIFYPARIVMDPSVSPLRNLRPAQRFQIMIMLDTMWTTIFCLGTGFWLYYGELLAFHVLVALGVFVTGVTFYQSSKAAEVSKIAA